MIKINVAKDFTNSPGDGESGQFSGLDFYDNLLLPKFREAVRESTVLEINFEGVINFTDKFIDKSFGELARNSKIKKDQLKTNLRFIKQKSTSELVDRVLKSIKDNLSE